jgi:hypothetical protein
MKAANQINESHQEDHPAMSHAAETHFAGIHFTETHPAITHPAHPAENPQQEPSQSLQSYIQSSTQK